MQIAAKNASALCSRREREKQSSLSVDLLRPESLDVVFDQGDVNALVLQTVEDVVTVQIAWIEAGIVGRRKLSTRSACRSYVEQTCWTHIRHINLGVNAH